MAESIELDWAAPIVPGHSMMGLVLGTARHEVLKILFAQPQGDGPDSIVLRNSPVLRLEHGERGSIVLRAIGITPVIYPWHNEVACLSFTDGALSNIQVRLLGSSHAYRGTLFGKVGLGCAVAELLEFCPLEYIDEDEWFYPTAKVSARDGPHRDRCLSDD